MNYTPEQFERLPKWAQSEIRRLDGISERATAQLNALASDKPSIIGWKQGLEMEKPLPDGADVRFRVLEEYRHQDSIACRIMKWGGKLYLDVQGDSSLKILPNASNSIRITLE